MNDITTLGMTAYSELDLFCIIMIGMMFIITCLLTKRTGKRLGALVGIVVICYCIYLLTDVIWIVGDHYGKLTITSRYIVRCVSMAMIGISSALWLIHVCNETNINLSTKPLLVMIVIIPVVFLTYLAASAPWNNLLFSISKDGDYVRGPMFEIFSIVSYACVIIAGIISLIDFFAGKGNRRMRALGMFLYSVLVVAGGLAQIKTGYHFAQLGFSLALVIYLADIIKIEVSRQNKALKAAQAKADNANKAKTAFLFNMSHDIRTPISSIIGYSNMARDHLDDRNKVNDCLNKVDLSSRQLLELVNNVLDMARIESGKATIEEKPIHISKLMEELYNTFKDKAEKKKLEFEIVGSGINHDYVYTDEERLKRILNDILDNAIRYSNSGGRAFCKVSEGQPPREGYCAYEFTIEDDGIGMSEERVRRLFDSYTRDNLNADGEKGTGLSLSIVKKLVDLMDGEIEVQSEPGDGTTVNVSLMFKIAEEDNSEHAIPNKDIFAGKRVLLVEDNILNMEIARDILEQCNMIVEDAHDGVEAVEMFADSMGRSEEQQYDFILMDIQMPRMNGYKATSEIRKIQKECNCRVPVIALTADAFSEDKAKAMRAGMDAHVSKPIDLTDLLTVMQNVM